MANTREELVNRFIAFSNAGKVQSAIGTGILNADIDVRDKCTITREEVITRRDIRDCRNEDLVSSTVITRLARFTLNYAEVTPQIEARWAAYFFGQAANPTGAPANEVQRLTRSGTVSGGTFTLAMTLEGRLVTTKSIAWNATTTDIINALTAARMLYIHPGDVTASGGTPQVETLVIVGTSSGGTLPVTVKAAGSVALAGAGKVVNVTLANLDDASASAAKVRAALAADTDVNAFFIISGAGANAITTARVAAANDVTMELSNTAVAGMSAATSANTTPGIAGNTWGATGITLTFASRLAHANLPQLVADSSLITGGGSILNTNITQGDQNFHAISRSTSRNKVRFSFVLGYEDNTATIEKFIDYVCESFNPQASLGTDPSLQVTLIGPWEFDSLEPGYTVPDCINPTPLLTEECRVEVDGNFESADVNSVSTTLNDNVPIDRLSAFPYDGIDVQSLIRGRQPTYNTQASIFGIRTDHIYALAEDERTQAPVEIITHYGMPGNRFTLIQPESKIRFQNNREQFVGTAELSAVNIEALPLKDGSNPPIAAEAHLDQATAFLVVSA